MVPCPWRLAAQRTDSAAPSMRWMQEERAGRPHQSRAAVVSVPREDPAVRPPAAGRPVSRPCRWVSQRQAPVAVVLPPPPCGHGRTVGGGKRPIGQNPPGGARVRGRRTNPGAHLRKGSPVRWSSAAMAPLHVCLSVGCSFMALIPFD